MATTTAPTTREVVWLALLLFFLLVATPRGKPAGGPTRDLYTKTWSGSHQTASRQAQNTLAVASKPPATRLSWRKKQVPQTQILAHTPGWTIFDKLYVLRGVVYIVSDEPAKVPNVTWIYSKGLWIENGEDKVAARLPTDEDIRVIGTQEAAELFGTGANILDGVTYFTNDPYQFVTHYYHWSAELWFGFWRTYTALDPFVTKDGNTTLPPIRRFMFNHLDAYHWRDYASMNEFVIRSALPSAVMEFRDDWRDRAEMNRPFVFERVVVADRSAAMRSWNFARFQRTAASPAVLPGSAHWWQPLRDHAVQLAGLDPSVEATRQPVITYISRQDWGRRMLIKEDHEKLVEELYKLRDNYGIEVNVVSAEKMTRDEQIELAGRTTILMGVHGNGLTSLIWMKPSPRSTVMEFFFPGGFAFDYEYTTRALGMTHYGFWGSSYFTSPGVPEPKYVEGFQGNSIPLDGALVARLCLERLTLTEEVDD